MVRGVSLHLAAAALVAAQEEYTTPVNKVIALLDEMHKKAIATQQSEEKVAAAFAQKCADDQRVMQGVIAREDEDIEQYAAEIAKAKSDISILSAELDDLGTEKAFCGQDMTAASKVRTAEKTDFAATDQDLEETLLALDKAISVLKSKAATVEELSFLQANLQVSAATQVRSALVQFLEQSPVAATKYAYESQMSGVIDMLEGLKEKFYQEKSELLKTEKTAKHQYDTLMEVRSGEIDGYSQAIARKSKRKGKRQSDQGRATEAKAETEKARLADQQELAEQTANCNLNVESFGKQQSLRKGEIEALAEALRILGSQAVKGSAEKHLPGAADTNTNVALIQVTSSTLKKFFAPVVTEDMLERVTDMLNERATKFSSPAISLLVTKASQGANPLKKVTEMIRDLISQLMQETAQEADQKGFCGAKLNANKVEREAKTEEVESLTADKNKLVAVIGELTEKLEMLTEQIATLSRDRDATAEERAANKAENLATIKDAQSGALAVSSAISVLQAYYAKAASDATTLDQDALDAKERENAVDVYNGQQDKASGVLSILELIQSDFSRLEAETTADEESAAAKHEQFMNSSEVDLEVKKTEKEHTQELKAKRENCLATTDEELKTTSDELAAAEKVFEELKPVCIDTGMSYEERVEKREAEIASLKEVLEVLAQNESGAI